MTKYEKNDGQSLLMKIKFCLHKKLVWARSTDNLVTDRKMAEKAIVLCLFLFFVSTGKNVNLEC